MLGLLRPNVGLADGDADRLTFGLALGVAERAIAGDFEGRPDGLGLIARSFGRFTDPEGDREMLGLVRPAGD